MTNLMHVIKHFRERSLAPCGRFYCDAHKNGHKGLDYDAFNTGHLQRICAKHYRSVQR